MSIIAFNNFSGIKPRFDPFALPAGSAVVCNNVTFESGGVKPVLGSVFEPGEGDNSIAFPSEDIINGGEIANDYVSDKIIFPDGTGKPVTIISSPSYITSASGLQTAFAYFVGSEGTGILTHSSTSLSGPVLKTNRGYVGTLSEGGSSGFNVSFPEGEYQVSSKFLGLVNQITDFDAGGTATYTSPPVSTGSKVFSSHTNDGKVTISIAGGSQDVHVQDFKGYGFGPDENTHAPVYLFFKADHDYTFHGSFQYRYGIVNDNGELVYISNSSDLRVMEIGDGVYLSFPVIESSTDGETFTPISKGSYRLFRAYNRGEFKEIAVPSENITQVS